MKTIIHSDNIVKKNERTFFVLILLQLVNFTLVGQLDTVHYFPPLHARVDVQALDHYLYLSTPSATPIEVTITDGSGGWIASETISQGNPVRYTVGLSQDDGFPIFLKREDIYTAVSNKGLIVSADEEFFAEFRVRANSHAESFTGKGREAIGKQFRIGGIPQVLDQSTRNFVFGILSLEDNNTITVSEFDPAVSFSQPVGTVTPGGNVIITLNQGESFVFSGYTDIPANLSGIIGALVESTGNIVLTNGNHNGNVINDTGQDILLDQSVPISKLGTDHIVVEGNGNNAMERPIVIAHYNNTQVFINGDAAPVVTLNAGEHILLNNNLYQGAPHRNMFIQTSQPAYVYQHLGGTTNNGAGGLCLIPYFHCRLANSVDLIPDAHRVGEVTFLGGLQIITEQGATVTVNGTTLTNPSEVEGGEYETYKVSGVTGNQVINSSGSLMVGILGGDGNRAYAGFYSGFADVPDGEVSASTTTVCQGDDPVEVVFTAFDGTPDYTFHFSINETEFTQGADNGEESTSYFIDTDTPGVYTIELTKLTSFDVEEINSCDYNVNSTLEIEVLSLPEASITGDFSTCKNDSTTQVIFSGEQGEEPYTFTYSINNGSNETIISTGSTAILEFPTNESGTFTIDLIEVEEASDLSCSQEQEGTVTIEVFELPEIHAGSDSEICLGESVSLNASGGSSYVWSNGIENGETISPQTTATYSVVGMDDNECSSTDSLTVFVNPLPQINAGMDQNICEGESVVLSADGAETYIWNNNVENGVPFVPDVSATYTVVGIDENGCEGTSEVTVVIHEIPEVNFSANPTSGFVPLTVDFENNSALGNDFFWDFGNGNSYFSNESSLTEVYDEVGLYTVVLFAENEYCNNSLSLIIEVIFEPPSFEIPNVFTPNGDGTNDLFKLIDVKGEEYIEEFEVVIFNRWGMKIQTFNDILFNWDGTTKNGDRATEGVYFYKISYLVATSLEKIENNGFVHLVRD